MSRVEEIAETEAIAPEDLRDAARRLVADKADRRTGWGNNAFAGSAEMDAEMAERGWLLLTIPVARGGLGQTFAALAPIYEELGRALSPVSLAATMAATDVLAREETAAGSALLDRIAAGQARVAITFATLDENAADIAVATVPVGAAATDLIILPTTGGGHAALLNLVDAKVTPVVVWDRTRTFCDISVAAAQVSRLAIDGCEAAAVARAHLDLATSWDSLGGAQQALEEAVAYMGTRRQFDRPIGSFQALKHRAADHKVAIDVARALAQRATDTFAARSEAWSDLAGQARLLAVDAFRAVAEDSVQFHGGIGFTWEHDCHLFLKRALMNEVLSETTEQVRDRVAPGVFRRALRQR